ncbi:DNA repair protein rhp54 [Hordeum vulgare]|nr:DNA repair protein rhp54 [Hordeum vulgare]
MVQPESLRALATHPIPGFHVYLQAFRLSGECSPEVSVVAPSMPAPIDLNATPVAGVSSSDGLRKHAREMLADLLLGARTECRRPLTMRGPTVSCRALSSRVIRRPLAVPPRLDTTPKRPKRGVSFTPSTYDQVGMQVVFMQDQVGLDLDGFLLDH